MVNGTPGMPIYYRKGLRQGDTVSPMLFLLIMEPLQSLFELAVERGSLTPLARSGIKQRVSMFADDVMIFLKPDDMDLHVCASLLHVFGDASGLRVNLAKSAALPIHCSDDILNRVVQILGCPAGSYPSKYLCLPLTLRKHTAT